MKADSSEIRLAGTAPGRFLGIVRGLFSWLLMFGVIAGLCGRVFALDHSHAAHRGAICHQDDAGCPHDHGHGPTEDHSHEDCPPGPHEHHTHACCHPAPLAGAEIQIRGLVPPGGSLAGVAWHAARPPEEPVFALDKPPLI